MYILIKNNWLIYAIMLDIIILFGLIIRSDCSHIDILWKNI